MKRSSHIFFTSADEDVFSAAIRKARPDAAFIDGSRWPSPEPPLVPSIALASESAVFIWPQALFPVLPVSPHTDRVAFQGPQSGCVVQFVRSRSAGPLLRCGTLSVGLALDPPATQLAMAAFVKLVWAALHTVSTNQVVCVSPSTGVVLNARCPGFRVGRHASQWCAAASDRFFRDATAANHYRPGIPSAT